jgi:hypothetical protein
VRFIRRLIWRSGPHDDVAEGHDQTPVSAAPPPDEPATAGGGKASAPPVVCPSCAFTLDPAPLRSRRCPSCRQRITVRRLDGRTVLLVDDAVPIFDRERQRVADQLRWTDQRTRWLALAGIVRAPAARLAKLAAAPLSASVVEDSRTFYLSSAERAVRTARTAKRWPEVARIRRQQAAELYAAAGAPIPPPDEVIAAHREGALAELRGLSSVSDTAELVSAGCCRICRADDQATFRIPVELRTPRLPHEGCAKGLCGCHWWLALPGPKTRQRKRRAKAPIAAPPLPEKMA